LFRVGVNAQRGSRNAKASNLPETRAISRSLTPEASMSSFATYIVGFIILVVGLALAAYLLNVPSMWIAVGVIVLIGIGVLMATSRTKPRDPPVA
jgi:uncharacterized membrane protein YiaA